MDTRIKIKRQEYKDLYAEIANLLFAAGADVEDADDQASELMYKYFKQKKPKTSNFTLTQVKQKHPDQKYRRKDWEEGRYIHIMNGVWVYQNSQVAFMEVALNFEKRDWEVFKG